MAEMSCSTFETRLADWLEDDAALGPALHGHAEACAPCAELLRQLERIRSGDAAPDRSGAEWASFDARLAARLAREERPAPRRIPLRWLGLAAAVALGVLAGVSSRMARTADPPATAGLLAGTPDELLEEALADFGLGEETWPDGLGGEEIVAFDDQALAAPWDDPLRALEEDLASALAPGDEGELVAALLRGTNG